MGAGVRINRFRLICSRYWWNRSELDPKWCHFNLGYFLQLRNFLSIESCVKMQFYSTDLNLFQRNSRKWNWKFGFSTSSYFFELRNFPSIEPCVKMQFFWVAFNFILKPFRENGTQNSLFSNLGYFFELRNFLSIEPCVKIQILKSHLT